MNDARLLIIGGESGTSQGWSDPLKEAGAIVKGVEDGEGALRLLDLLEPDLALVDLVLPGSLDGFDTCRGIRSRSDVPIAVASTTDGPYDEIVALAVGADHFLAADLPVEIVVARLRTVLRRSRGTVLVTVGGQDGAASLGGRADGRADGRLNGHANGNRNANGLSRSRRAPAPVAQQQLALLGGVGVDHPTELIVDGDLEIDLSSREVRVGGVDVALTRIEFDLLVGLARSPRRVLSRDQLMECAWDDPFDGSHVLDAHLSRMRGKISAAGGDRVAHAVRGVGFRLRA